MTGPPSHKQYGIEENSNPGVPGETPTQGPSCTQFQARPQAGRGGQMALLLTSLTLTLWGPRDLLVLSLSPRAFDSSARKWARESPEGGGVRAPELRARREPPTRSPCARPQRSFGSSPGVRRTRAGAATAQCRQASGLHSLLVGCVGAPDQYAASNVHCPTICFYF